MKNLIVVRLGLLAAIMLFTVISHAAFGAGAREGTVYTVSKAPALDQKIMKDAGINVGSYYLRITTGEGLPMREYTSKKTDADAISAQERKACAAADRLRQDIPDLKDVVHTLGSPTRMVILEGEQSSCMIAYFGSISVFWHNTEKTFREIRFADPHTPYSFMNRIRIGATGMEDVFSILGQPLRRMQSREAGDGADRTLSTYIVDGEPYQYIMYVDAGVRMFFRNGKLGALYLFKPGSEYYRAIKDSEETQGDTETNNAAPAAVEPYSDVRNKVLGSSGGSLGEELIRSLWLNQHTRLGSKDEAILQRVIEEGKNPGLGVRGLHAQGVTGAGVAVAIIDQNLPGTGHPEYKGKVVKYQDFGTGQTEFMGSMHGPAVLSLLVGGQAGTAPEARVYYAAAPSWTGDASFYGKALRWLVDENEKLPSGGKIRVVSVSASPSGPGSPFTKNGADWDSAVKLAASKGILVLDCTQTYGRIGPCYYDPADPDNVQQATPGWPGQAGGARAPLLLAPTSYRSQAESYNEREASWQYTGRGGLSWGIPWAAGVLAMGWQVSPSLTPDAIMKLLADTAYQRPDGSRIIDPVRFIDEARKTGR
jgi:serine protease AprX